MRWFAISFTQNVNKFYKVFEAFVQYVLFVYVVGPRWPHASSLCGHNEAVEFNAPDPRSPCQTRHQTRY